MEAQLVLQAWEAVSSERELQGVLEAVTEVLLPVVPFESVGIVALQGDHHDLYALHVVGMPHRKGETLAEFFQRREMAPRIDAPKKPLRPYDSQLLNGTAMNLTPYTCDDVLAKDTWWEHEFHLAAGGVRAYCGIPLLVRGELIGSAVFTRARPEGFTALQLEVLGDVCRALGVAVANARANEEIRRLRDQLEAENISLRAQLGQAPWFEDIVGDSPALRRVLERVEQVAATDATVLLTGETGTGKELIARAIHRASPRAHGPLIKVHCAAIPPALLASELFGHERGAFTGAVERRKGRFEQAQGGTLFLDEIGELPQETQVMLLRVIQEREFERLGGSQTVRVDVRLVAATNRDLAGEVRAGRFRSDLYYRLNVFPVPLPPLRAHREDIAPLVAHFAAKHGGKLGKKISRVGARSLALLTSYDWPGNIRELENVIERAVILSRGGTLAVEREALAGALPPGALPERLEEQEREAIESALRLARGRVSGEQGAARRLGMAASTLEFRIRRLGIDKYRYRREA